MGSLPIELFWVTRLRVDDFSINVHRVVVLKRWVAGVHLIDQNPERPPVHWAAVTFVEQDFRGNVLRSTTDCVGTFSHDLGKTEVNHFQVAVPSDHNVLGLQVSVANVFGVQVLENQDHLRSIEPVKSQLHLTVCVRR